MKEVTAAIIINKDLILIARRGKDEKLAGKWEFPGGKIEDGETSQQCLRREIKEELNIDVKVGNFFEESIYVYPDGEIKLLAYFTKIINGNIKLSVHDEVKWVSTKEMDKFDFAPADIKLVEKLKEEF
ncbi:TPA: 8-oxo-dGTP diphosphatase MutT [Clostridium botulinum]|uniref:8-oxo-dGTP diphosphatase MutT n=1 Tax=Clostridium botulinum TaxID=1491 RepID=UPI0008FCDAD3|nr:8-oxo-dGTP diphosphatase MutT [Clostridium botulinum]APC78517.1 mutator mutT family protein [Clostridium botulinum]APU61313.1 mutator mutT family protein [Clostridium botulinum]EKS4344799.1 8-oxo-dGTP diphosphatase MutT [Clostridium botulinum]EKS4395272.1 8-oxo-dGTP diphosphatase MutT [Clostridium botulinum]MCS4447324.1 8-oxo-dGTP diphosphatase MutT [Clostridium botulinum]